MGLKGFYWIFLNDISVGVVLTVVKIDEIGRSIVLAVWMAFWAVPGVMSLFSTLEAGIRRIPGGSHISLEIGLGVISLVAVVIPLSLEVIAMIVSLSAVVPRVGALLWSIFMGTGVLFIHRGAFDELYWGML